MTRIVAVAAFAVALALALLVAATVPSPAVAGSLSLRISPSELSPLDTATLSGKVSPKLKKPGKLFVQVSPDNKGFTTIKTLKLPKGATKYKTTFTAGTLLGPVFLRTKFGTLATKGLKLTVTETVDIRIENFAFSTKVLTVKRWTTVRWTNNDSVGHTVTAVDGLNLSATPTGLFDSRLLAPGHTFQVTFTKPGTFFYECTIHSDLPALHAEVIVQ